MGLSGYVGTMSFADVTPHMKNVVMAAYWFIPGLCTGLSMIPMLFYKLDRKEVRQQIRDFIAKRDSETVAK